jgi:hypothetical protein
MRNKAMVKIYFFIGILLSNSILAEPIVIYDSGRTIHAQQFYPFKQPNPKELEYQAKQYKINKDSINKLYQQMKKQ